MRAPGKLLAAAALATAASSCNWGAFDDLKDEAWVQIAEREDTKTGGDYGVEVVALPPESGQKGIRYVIAAGDPAGLAQATFDATGKMTEQIGFNGEVGGKGALEPMTNLSTIFSMAPYGGDDFIAGAPELDGVLRYEAGLRNGTAILTNGKDQTGRRVATGNLGFGSANPDVVTIGRLSLSIVRNGSMPPISCNLKPPNMSTNPVVFLESLAVANVVTSTPHDEIIVGSFNLGDQPRIFVIDPQAVVIDDNCPETMSFAVEEATPPASIQVAQLDGATTPLDLVTGTLRSGEGKVTVYLNPDYAPGATLTGAEIPATNDEEPSTVRGGRIRIANIDGGAEPEIIVADPGATVDGVSLAGKVQIYRWGPCAGGGEVRGPACLVRTLHDPTPARNDQFGRALAIGTFVGRETKTILAVAQKAKLWVYFQVSPEGTDPRE